MNSNLAVFGQRGSCFVLTIDGLPGEQGQQEIAGGTAVAGSCLAARGFDTTYRCHRLGAPAPVWSFPERPVSTALVNANTNID